MVGGRSPLARDERLYRFQFPERPGALDGFLTSMHPNWNISLFHYRNQGADFGRILIGIQVPPGEKAAFQEFLDTLGYPYVDETETRPIICFFAKSWPRSVRTRRQCLCCLRLITGFATRDRVGLAARV